MPLFSALRSNSFASRRAEPLILDLAQASNAAPPNTGSSRTPPSSSSSSSSSRQVSGFGASGSGGDASANPRFNDPCGSDVKIEVVNGKGEIHCLLYLHSNVLREQSDYFFNTLVKRAIRDSGSSSSDPPPTTFTIQTSRHVPDPEIYITVFKLFYQDEDLLAEDIVCIGSVWKVLQILVVSAELQSHSCTTACVDYLEAVPWSDEELEDIVRLMPQLERLQDAQPVLGRLPVKGWDQESIADALRMLLIRAVAFLDALGDSSPVPSASHSDSGAMISVTSEETRDTALLVREKAEKQGTVISMRTENRGEQRADERGESRTESLPSPHETGEGVVLSESIGERMQEEEAASSVRNRDGGGGGGRQGEVRRRQSSQLQGLVECREAACSILRSHQGPLLPLKTKKLLLRETFVDLLRCVWSEQRQQSQEASRSTSQQQSTPGSPAGHSFAGHASARHPSAVRPSAVQSSNQHSAPGSFAERHESGIEADVMINRGGVYSSRIEAESDVMINGGGVYVNRRAADGRGGVDGMYRRSKSESSRDQPLSASPALLESVYGRQGAFTWLIQVMLEFSMADEVFKWLASDKGFLSLLLTVYRTSTLAAISESYDVQEERLSRLFVVKTALLGMASAILGKRLVVHPQMRMEFVRTWVPVLAEICSTSHSGEALLFGLPIAEEEQSNVLNGYNELVLTLPANDQRAIFQLWYLKIGLRMSSATPAFQSERRTAAPGAPWFSLSPAYKRWLVRLGPPCAFAAVDV